MKLKNQLPSDLISHHRRAFLTLLFAATAGITAARADSPTDNWLAPNSSLLDTSNWSTGKIPAANVTGVINDTGSTNGHVLGLDINGNPGTGSIGDLDLTGGTAEKVGTYNSGSKTLADNFTLTLLGSTLNSVANTIIANEGSGTTFTFQNDAQPSDKSPNTGQLTLALANSSNTIQSSGNGNNVIVNVSITGSGDSVTFLGSGTSMATGGTLELGAGSSADAFGSTNTFSGGLTIGATSTNAGIVRVDGTKALPTSGTVTVNTNSQLLLNGSATYGGTSQSLVLNGTGTPATGGALTTTSGNASTWQGTISVATSSSINVQGSGGSLTASGVISGSGQLQATGAGALLLTKTNSYTGGTSVAAGIVYANGGTAGSGSATGTGAIHVAANGQAGRLGRDSSHRQLPEQLGRGHHPRGQ